MIEHAWTVVCDKTIVDEVTKNISLDAIEQLKIGGRFEIPADGGIIVPVRVTVASLWYRSDPAAAESGQARIRYLGPDGTVLATFPNLQLDLKQSERTRTRTNLEGLPVTRSGRYVFEVEIKDGERWKTIARIPFSVELSPEVPVVAP